MPYVSGQEVFVHLAYLDDSGDKNSKFRLMVGVIIEGREFRDIELALGLLEDLVPEEKRDKFEEFHAWQLFGGYGPFEGTDYEKRMGAMLALLRIITSHKISIVYGAVDTAKLGQEVYASADPIDICFRLCVEGIEAWAEEQPAAIIEIQQQGNERLGFKPLTTQEDFAPVVVLISDDYGQNGIKNAIRKSFRELRSKVRPSKLFGKTWFLHDDLYFGNSKDSIGIQLADLCAYLIRKHLEGDEVDTLGFYMFIQGHIAHSRIEPGAIVNPHAVVDSNDDANAKSKTAQ
jgi:hypothetical protein